VGRRIALGGVAAVWAISACAQPGITADAYKQRLGAALEEVSRHLPDVARRRVEFTLNLFIAHEAWIHGMPVAALTGAVDAFKEAGVDRVDINPGLSPWLENDQAVIAKYDAAVERIRQHGMKLALNPQYSPVRHKFTSFAQWRPRALAVYAALAARYQPDIFVVAHEPSTMAARLGGKVTVQEWTEFVRDAALLVRSKSPNSRIGAGGLASERKYFEAFAQMPLVEVLTLDLYSLRDLPVYQDMIRAARAAGKPVYIEETWRPPYFQPRPGMTLESASMQNVGNREFEALDSRWLQVLTRYAQVNNLEAITPVWMFPLFKYVEGAGDLDDAGYNRAVVEAIARGERTTTFRTLQELVRENQRLPR
jgi:hypothetical protein